jgi:TolB-like protein
VLVLLATRARQLVTREEIKRMIWAGETFVDFELGLNYCLNQIRTALGDHARVPRYIETVPCRGYRFIASVEPAATASEPTLTLPPSVAVLPFANLSADKRNAYFSDGLADEIITALTRLQGLRVTARTSAFAFRAKKKDVREISAKLGVGAVLEGSVQRSARRIRVSAQLVSVTDGFHLWSEHYDCKAEDIFAIQDEISREIARALEVHLAPSRMARPTSNLNAYNCWLKARHYQHYENLAAFAKCRACLDQATALDPLFPHPYVSLADLFLVMAHFGVIPLAMHSLRDALP